MKLVTFNIRCDYGQDGENNFDCRKPLILRRIAREQPDIIGFQEVLPHVQRWLRGHLEGYTVVGCPRGADCDGEAMTIAVRDETAELLGLETFWLSPEPDRPGSRYDGQSDCPRICTVAAVLCRGLGALRVYNTHLDHLSAGARALGLRQILRRMETDRARHPLPAALLGDFNAWPGAAELAVLTEFPALGLRDVTGALPVTFHNYHRPGEQPGKIDYILLTDPLRAGQAVCWTDEEDGVYLSDHYPVCVEVLR